MISGENMDGRCLFRLYVQMEKIGLCSNRREFSTAWCAKGKSYLRDFRDDGRLHARIPDSVVDVIVAKLRAVAAHTPPGIAKDILELVRGIERDKFVYSVLSRRTNEMQG
jgi:hypothetical protein